MTQETYELYRYLNRSIPRLDSEQKVRGELKYLTDVYPEGMLHGYVLRSTVAHARILEISTEEAERAPGIRAVLTYKDIPGINGYGAIVPEIPVLAYERVRYYGEPLALIAADSMEQAKAAAEMIKVRLEPLPAVLDVDEAMAEKVKIHDKGNVARHTVVKRGDVSKAEAQAHLVLERTYRTPMQKHMFIEPEGGYAYVDGSGVVHVLAGGQSPYRDKLQISRVLGISPEMIRVKNYPTGGAFGGKDDATVQIHLALLAYRTRKPVRLAWTREESGIAGYHRTASKITIRTAVDREGRLLSNSAKIVLDSGAYQSFGPTILDVSIETINGPYRVPSYLIDAYLVYTNNGIASAFRGFGAPESNFAIESMMNELAAELGIDPVEIRLRNILRTGEEGPFGNVIRNSAGLEEALNRARSSGIWRRANGSGWIKEGVGVAVAIKGVGFGTLPDYPSAAVEVIPEGKVRVMFTNPDYGQGVITGIAQLAAERLQIPVSEIEVINADTMHSPDTGSSSASRTTLTAGSAVVQAIDEALSKLRVEAASSFGASSSEVQYSGGRFMYRDRSVTIYELARRLRQKGRSLRFEATFEVPRYPEPVEGTLEVPHMMYMYGVALVRAGVDALLGKVNVKEVEFYADIGNVINPSIASGQVEGGVVQGLGYATIEEYRYSDDGRPLNINFTTYVVPTARDSPEMYVEFVKSYDELGPYGAKGVGEIGIIPVGAALAEAVYRATGKRIRDLPITPWKLV